MTSTVGAAHAGLAGQGQDAGHLPGAGGQDVVEQVAEFIAQKSGARPGRSAGTNIMRQRSERSQTPAPSAMRAGPSQAYCASRRAVPTSFQSTLRIASQPQATETAVPTTAEDRRRRLGLTRVNRYLTRAQMAGKPSRQVIFLPSA